ncbi:MAG TPA: hypothetical protein PLI13_07770, partial [Paracoccus sp. (in: a-proteobacteria)]|nr:hypothetical protein [Paracoccus sp. (in: a-proteobacteria)]
NRTISVDLASRSRLGTARSISASDQAIVPPRLPTNIRDDCDIGMDIYVKKKTGAAHSSSSKYPDATPAR